MWREEASVVEIAMVTALEAAGAVCDTFAEIDAHVT
jgi:hypothetical protein